MSSPCSQGTPERDVAAPDIEGVMLVIDATPRQLRPPPECYSPPEKLTAAAVALLGASLTWGVEVRGHQLLVTVPVVGCIDADLVRQQRDNAIDIATRAFEEG